ncbi:MAG: hypothetical protein ACRDFT_07200 [bacterium]
MRKKSPSSSPAERKRTKAKVDWSSATRPHQVQDPRTMIEHSSRAKRKRREEGGTYQDQSP